MAIGWLKKAFGKPAATTVERPSVRPRYQPTLARLQDRIVAINALQVVYGPGDYNMGAGTPPGDPMGVFINGNQKAFVPGTTLNINPTTINGTTNSQFYVENTLPGNRNTRMHGFTVPLNGTFT